MLLHSTENVDNLGAALGRKKGDPTAEKGYHWCCHIASNAVSLAFGGMILLSKLNIPLKAFGLVLTVFATSTAAEEMEEVVDFGNNFDYTSQSETSLQGISDSYEGGA